MFFVSSQSSVVRQHQYNYSKYEGIRTRRFFGYLFGYMASHRARGTLSILLLATFMVSGCGLQKIPPKILEILLDPSIAVGEPKDQPSTAEIVLVEHDHGNVNELGEHAPIDLWIFQLADDGKFLQSEFELLTADPKKELGTTFIDVQEFQATPTKSKIVKTFELGERISHIGVVGGFNKLDKSKWRVVEEVKDKGETYKIVIVVKPRRLEIDIHR